MRRRLARLNRLPEAITQINIVRTKAGLSSKTAADLPTQAAVLDEIFKQRTYSLFATGLHWADERRFGKIALAKVRYLPYPLQVRATNTNTPANPTGLLGGLGLLLAASARPHHPKSCGGDFEEAVGDEAHCHQYEQLAALLPCDDFE